jgi:hypothetical protein
MYLPVHIHSGNGEGMDLLSTHYPYKLENVIRDPVDFPQKPVKIVMIHGGYPHVDEAAYLTHIFPNVWYDLSLLNPIANRGLHQRLLTIFETARVNARKVMDKTDAELAALWVLKRNDQELFALPRLAAFRSFVLNHMIHHRGQLSVYLRLNDIPVPAIYGPTADEG